MDACSHYRSKVGGVVKANSNLYEEMKKDKSFFNKFIPEMIKILSDKIIKTDVGTFIQSAPNSNRPLNCSTMGMYKLNIEYNHKVSVGVNYVELHLFGSDKWDFQTSKDKGVFKNLTQEIIPGMIAGDGKPFDISYDFKYTIKIVPKYFYIQSAANAAYSLDINGGSCDNEANVQIYKINYMIPNKELRNSFYKELYSDTDARGYKFPDTFDRRLYINRLWNLYNKAQKPSIRSTRSLSNIDMRLFEKI